MPARRRAVEQCSVDHCVSSTWSHLRLLCLPVRLYSFVRLEQSLCREECCWSRGKAWYKSQEQGWGV
ncbi:unnamed protein product [Gongylonema pulchrum]|uniref:Uncharacterized protein n=1 Tax=Gongylonema pulchrum TaxID=637853 RepID=A0A183ES94_9BILA|nr:unnamed protein product [Gongylonema pulchrum]